MVVPRAGALGPDRPPSCAQTDGSCLQPLWQALCEFDRSEAALPEGRTPTLQKNKSPSVNFGLPKAKLVDVGSFYFAFKAFFQPNGSLRNTFIKDINTMILHPANRICLMSHDPSVFLL